MARRPHVAEHDFTGVIVDAGSSNYKVGDPVFGFVPVRKYLSLVVDTSDSA
jgi:NADPH:quinone reductase-like Zn-dependent oxidoreductase